MPDQTVLVTGASGFVGKHCIAALLKSGYGVRGTLRNLTREQDVRKAIANAGVDHSRLTFIAADLDHDTGWSEAVAGCTYVLHVASPFPITQPDMATIVATARDGALRVLRAAASAGVQRVVLTSSTVAIMYAGKPKGHIYTEADWTDTSNAAITPYMASKTLAEQAAWAFIKSEGKGLELAVINPAFIQGPALDGDLSTSLEVLHLMAKGAYPASPRISFPVCDVRDVAAAHVAAMTHPQAAGERFIVANGELPLIMLGRIMAAELPDLKSKVPKFELPDFAVRLIAMFDKRLRSVLPELGAERKCSSEKVQDVLGLKLTPAKEAVTAAARSLRSLRVI